MASLSGVCTRAVPAIADGLPEAVTANVGAITEYQYERIGTLEQLYEYPQEYPRCSRACLRLWKRERALDPEVPSSQELWRELYTLATRVHLFEGFTPYTSQWGFPFPPGGAEELNKVGRRAVVVDVPAASATGSTLRYPGEPLIASTNYSHTGTVVSSVIRAPTLAWTGNNGATGTGGCPGDHAPPDPPGPGFILLTATSQCDVWTGTDWNTVWGATLNAYYRPMTFAGAPTHWPSNDPPNTRWEWSRDPGFDTAREAVLSELSNHGGDYSALINWLDVGLGGPGQYAPTREALYGAINPAARNLAHTCAGDPVDCATGNFTETFTDTAVVGPGVTLTQDRSYNSLAAAAGQRGPFGYGWAASFRDHLDIPPEPDGDLVVHQANGSQVRFIGDLEDGQWRYRSDNYVQATLARSGDTFTLTLPDQLRLVFDGDGRLQREIDRNGNATTLTYDGDRLIDVADPVGRHLTYTYNNDDTVASVTDPMHHTVAYDYEGGNLVSVTDVGGKVTQFVYDSHHRITSVRDPRGHGVDNVYDKEDRVVSQTDALDHETTWAYATDATTITDPSGSVTEEHFKDFLPTSVVRAKGTTAEAETTFAYDGNFNMVKTTDPNGHVWKSTYDPRGNRISEIDPLDRETTYRYDARNNVTKTVTPLGKTTNYEYDGAGRLWLIKSYDLPGRQQTQEFQYDDRGLLTRRTQYLPHSRSWINGYDSRGNLTSAKSPMGLTTAATYDLNGHVLTTTTPRGKTTTTVRDAYGAALTNTDALAKTTTYEYDAAHNLVSVTDRNGHQTTSTYDALNRPIETHRPDGSTQQVTYTAAGQRATQTDGLGHTTRYAYDAQHRLRSISDPLNRTTTFTWDGAGNKLSVEDAGHHITVMDYDAANRLKHVTYDSSTGNDVAFMYDADGRRTSMTDDLGTTRYTYDIADRLASQTSAAGQTTSYGYDDAGRLTSITYPDGLGAVAEGSGDAPTHVTTGTVTRTYDDDDHLTSVTDWLGHTTAFSYDNDGNLKTIDRPNGVDATYGYDDNDSLASIADAGSTTALGRDFASQLTSTDIAGASSSFGYDAVDRLTSASGTSYGYDDADHLTTIAPSGAAAIDQHFDDADQLTSRTQGATTVATLDYDAEGRRTTVSRPGAASTNLTWSPSDQLLSFTGPDATGAGGTVAETYAYDGAGLRQTKTSDGQRTHEAYDLSGELPVMIVDGTTAYVTGPGGLPVEQITNDGTIRYFHHDQLGSTTALTDSAGATVQTYRYNTYGQLTSATPTVENPFRFAGQYTDAKTGLQNLRARYYDPETGQFLSRDPLESSTGQPYAYADDNPTNATDPSGLFPWQQIGDAIGSVVPPSVSDASARVLDVISGGATSDIVCNGLTWHNGAMLALAAIPTGRVEVMGERLAADAAGSTLSQAGKRRLAKRLGEVPRSFSPVAQGGSARTGRWWEYDDVAGQRKIVVEHPDGTVHVGTPKPQSTHATGGPPKYYDYGNFGHVGE